MLFWFEAFRLKDNPFKYIDAVAELSSSVVPSIEGDFLLRIGSFLEGGVSCIVVGDRGVGKSRLAVQLRRKGEVVVFGKQDYQEIEVTKPKKGKGFGGEIEEEDVADYRYVFPKGDRVIVDFPDNLDKKAVIELVTQIKTRLARPATVILLCNREQYQTVRRYDTLARLPVIEFPKADPGFYRHLYNDRVKAFCDGEPVSPFKPEVVERLTEMAITPRSFLQICSLLLTRMWIDGVNEPCGLLFLKKLKELKEVKDLKVVRNETDLLQNVVTALKATGRIWVSAQELVNMLSEKYRLSITNERLGRLMKDLGYTRRYNPDAEYRVN